MPSKKSGNTQQLHDYAGYLNSILNKTVTDSRLTVLQVSNCLFVTCYQNDAFIPLVLKPKSFLHFRQRASVNASGKIIVEESRYIFSKSRNPDDEEKWIFRYEYSVEPERDKIVPHAHLHVNADAVCNNGPMKHVHFPTARISLEQIIAHLIVEHGIRPKSENWFDLLHASHKGFMERRTDRSRSLFP